MKWILIYCYLPHWSYRFSFRLFMWMNKLDALEQINCLAFFENSFPLDNLCIATKSACT